MAHHTEHSTNRVYEAISLFTEQEANYKAVNPVSSNADVNNVSLKIQYYGNVLNRYRKGATLAERKSMSFIRHELKSIRAKINPSVWNKFYHHPFFSSIRSFVAGNFRNYTEHKNALSNLENAVIKEHNFHNLKDTLRNAGFNMQVDSMLQKMMSQGLNNFHIRYTDPLHCKNTDYILHFEKVPGSDVYYFSKFDALSRPDLASVLKKENPSIKATFSMLEGVRVSAQESAILVNNGSVCKVIDGRERWVALDLVKHSHSKVALRETTFNVAKYLSKLPLRQTDGQYIEKLVTALKAGLSRSAELLVNNRIVKCVLRAAPDLNKIQVTDNNGAYLDIGKMEKNTVPQLSQEIQQTLTMQDDQSNDPVFMPHQGKSIR
jgi:hypothetical protein